MTRTALRRAALDWIKFADEIGEGVIGPDRPSRSESLSALVLAAMATCPIEHVPSAPPDTGFIP